jgi:hypothetical protein
MHPTVVQARVADLIANGWSDTAIAADTGLARTTVHYMREQSARRLRCPRCWRGGRPTRFTPGEYAELLGFYLGDGHVVAAGRTYRLRLSLDARDPRLAADARALLEAVFESNRVSVTHLGTRSTIVLSVYSVHLPCVFPQHGPGVKHERPIALEQWQHDLVATAPWSFIRGLILSDGCAFINRTGAYRYLSYEFCNSSADIRALFMATCDLVGVRYTTTADRVRIYRRASVAELATFVGTKR